MANTGFKQATIAYKVTPDGLPVDVYGQLTSESGNRQAIAVLNGYLNPNPAVYQVQFYFNENGTLEGTPSVIYDPAACPVSVFTVSKTTIILYPEQPTDVFNIYSSYGWELVGSYAFVNFIPSTGPADTTEVTATRTSTLGQGYVTFQDNVSGQIVQVYVVNTDALGWILNTGSWNNLRFWEAGGIWNF